MTELPSGPVRLVGDIGGTNARFAVLDDDGVPVRPATLRVDDFPSLAAAVRTFVAESGIENVKFAAVAVANPVTGDRIKLTNNHWALSIEETRESLGLEELHVVNDFTALAMSLPHLARGELQAIGGGEGVADRTLAVIGPGTGLGVSGLVPCGTS